MFQNLPKNIKFILVLLGLLIVGLVIYGVYQKVAIAGKIAVSVNVVPSSATLTINGASYTTTGTIYLVPGKSYSIKASTNGFADFTNQQYIDNTNNSITIALTAVSDSAKQWAQNNQDQYLINEGQAGAAANTTGEAITNKNPIVQYLPLDKMVYSLGYKNDVNDPSNTSIIITVNAAEGYRNGAVEGIRSLGYDPTQYKIQFNDYQNPFASL